MTSKLPSRFLQHIYTLYILVLFLLPLTQPAPEEKIRKPIAIITKSMDRIETIKKATIPPKVKKVSTELLAKSIQNQRENAGLNLLIQDHEMCAQDILSVYTQDKPISDEDLQEFCPACIASGYVSTTRNYALEDQLLWMETEDIKELITGQYSHMCLYTKDDAALVLLGLLSEKETLLPEAIIQPDNIRNFSMQDLWQALIDYRHAHTKPDLQYSQSLCTYAQSRVSEHLSMYREKSIEEYDNKDKYPLDAHAGFKRDGESGEVFSVTGFNVVAENLAYWPTAEFPHQVIEWGWDTSTEGHKEAQLSTEYSHACLAGSEGFYVAIFARN